jgi:predicted SprT family Zn-dependent metalloprotease
MMENQQAFIDEVVPHELAHLLVWKHFGRVAPHGKEWKWMMEAVLGVPARSTHQFELESVRRNTFPYRCQCQQHQLTVRRHNRVVRGEATYRCVNAASRWWRNNHLNFRNFPDLTDCIQEQHSLRCGLVLTRSKMSRNFLSRSPF